MLPIVRPLVSTAFVTPYPSAFAVMVAGEAIEADTIEFLRKPDVKESHGYEATPGLKRISPCALHSTATGANRSTS